MSLRQVHLRQLQTGSKIQLAGREDFYKVVGLDGGIAVVEGPYAKERSNEGSLDDSWYRGRIDELPVKNSSLKIRGMVYLDEGPCVCDRATKSRTSTRLSDDHRRDDSYD